MDIAEGWLVPYILAMGMLVDNAIVIIDGILVDKSGTGQNSIAFSVGKRTAMPLLGATLIAILYILPICLCLIRQVYVKTFYCIGCVAHVELILSLAVIHTGFSLFRERRFC